MTFLAVLGIIFGVGLLMIASSIFNGYVLSVLWGWFVVPIFDAPSLGLIPAIGVALVAGYLTYQDHNCKRESKSFPEELLRSIFMAILKPSFALFFGWVFHLFM